MAKQEKFRKKPSLIILGELTAEVGLDEKAVRLRPYGRSVPMLLNRAQAKKLRDWLSDVLLPEEKP